MNFSDKLKEIRKNEGLSQEQLADRIGVSRQAITKWETGKGLPDIENMTILAEIFKTTIDELINETVSGTPKKSVYSSESIYDIECEKHFDINIGSANSIVISSGTDEKLHICLKSETLADIGSAFKIRFDERKNTLDVNCVNKNRISRAEAEGSLSVEITLPERYSDHCELKASVRRLEINGLRLRRLEYDGDAECVSVRNSSGSFEFTSKTDYDITADKITGRLDVNQWRAKTVVHIPGDRCPAVLNKGRKCGVFFIRNGGSASAPANGESGDVISISGIGSELTIDLT